MLKNWIVVTKQITNSGKKHKHKKVGDKYIRVEGKSRTVKNGFINHVNYLADRNRPAHINTNINVILNNASNISKAISERMAYRHFSNLKKAPIKNWATSFCLSLPSDFKVDLNSWRKVVDRLITDVASTTGIPEKIIKEHTHAVLHDESANPEKHTHVHVLVSNVINHEMIKAISQRKTTYAIKNGFNASVKALWGVDHKNYKPKRSGKINKPLWLARQEKLLNLNELETQVSQNVESKEKIINELDNKITTLIEHLILATKHIEKWAASYLKNLFLDAKKYALLVANTVSEIEDLSAESAKALDSKINVIEKKKTNAPDEAKVSFIRKQIKNKKIVKSLQKPPVA